MANTPGPETPQRTAWVERLLSTTSQRDAAKASGLNQPSLSRQIAANRIPTDTVLALARGHDYPEVKALIETGIISRDALDKYINQLPLPEIPTQQLLNELARRIPE